MRATQTTRATQTPVYTLGEELTNAITHGLGALLGLVGLVLLWRKGWGNVWEMTAYTIYGFSMFLLFLMSCLYHALHAPRAKRVFRVFDHVTIFLLIAGTYTPLSLLTLGGWVGWSVFGFVWSACIVGVVLNAVSLERFKRFSMICYLVSGWCAVLAIVPLWQSMSLPGLCYLFGGGLAYTVGVVFYRLKRIPYMHSIWHLFVLAAAVLQYLCILWYV